MKLARCCRLAYLAAALPLVTPKLSEICCKKCMLIVCEVFGGAIRPTVIRVLWKYSSS